MNIEKEKPDIFAGNPEAVAARRKELLEGRPLEERGIKKPEDTTKAKREKTPEDWQRQARAFKEMTNSKDSIEAIMAKLGAPESAVAELSKPSSTAEKYKTLGNVLHEQNPGDIGTEAQIAQRFMGHDVSHGPSAVEKRKIPGQEKSN